MMIRPARAGSATQRAVSISGAARCSVFCHENQSPNAPLKSSIQVSTGLGAAAARRSSAEQQQRRPASAAAPAGRSSHRSDAFTAHHGSADGELTVAAHDRADDAFDEVVHLLELDVGLLERLPAGDRRCAPLLSFRRRRSKMSKLPAIISRLDRRRRSSSPASAHHRAVRRHLDVAFLQAAAQEVRMRLAGLRRLDHGLVGGRASSTRRR